MNKYLLDSKETDYFILSYRVENNKIYVFLANNKSYILPYTKRNEEVIVSRMEKQASTLKKKEKSPFHILRYIIEAIIGVTAVLALGTGVLIVLGVIYAVFASLNLLLYIKTIDRQNEEIEKMQYFLKNQEGLNSVVEEEKNKKLLKDETIEKIDYEIKNSRKPFNINNIDHYKLSELKKLSEAVKEYYSNQEVYAVEKPIVLQKRLKQKQG